MIDIDLIKTFLAWSCIIHYTILMLWFLSLVLMKEQVFKLHSKLFNLSFEQLAVIHYSGMGLYKLLIAVFFLIPYVVLKVFI